jgi:hypothetical protein
MKQVSGVSVVTFFALGVACGAGCSSSAGSDERPAPASVDGSTDGAQPDGVAQGDAAESLCPYFQSVPSCPIAADAASCSARSAGCGLDSLPIGAACTGSQQCAAVIYPCPNWQDFVGAELTDGYICSCVNGVWACTDCDPGAGLCAEAGAPAPDDASVDGAALDAGGPG